VVTRYGNDNLKEHFADTRDTLCYATAENQDATQALVDAGGDICLVVGGYNSSNTSHLAKLCAAKFPTFHIESDSEILSADTIRHFDGIRHAVVETSNWLPTSNPVRILLTAGASCPDMLVDKVLRRVASVAGVEQEAGEDPLWKALEGYLNSNSPLAA
jgi:4-hydroxy-3-methylbut-2-enyl diphosphate reductase